MSHRFSSYIDGHWVTASGGREIAVVNPATEEEVGFVAACEKDEIDRAVAAARRAFEEYSQTTRRERIQLLERVLAEYQRRSRDVAAAISADIGAPAWFAEQMQAATGLAHLMTGLEVLKTYEFTTSSGSTRIDKVPIGVCGLITPWNWPINQIACKVVPALAVGCTMVLKPSEIAPRSAQVWTEILDAAGTPAGVFNLVTGDGAIGAMLSAHPDIDMVSFTGSTRAGVEVARAAAPTIKRVCQELGGKSANLVLDDAELSTAIPAAIQAVCLNSGQSCNAPTRLLVPRRMMDDVITLARAAAEQIEIGPPSSNAYMGPVVSAAQWQRVQNLIQKGLEEGATLVAGGPGKPNGFEVGFYVKPTVFANVTNDMRIAREEIFGPVLCIIAYDDEQEAIELANDSVYGLAGYVQSSDDSRALLVASRLRVGQVQINGAPLDFTAPFGGFKQSGNGREWGACGFSEYLELRAIMGAAGRS